MSCFARELLDSLGISTETTQHSMYLSLGDKLTYRYRQQDGPHMGGC